jgi:transposase InsO family protein
MGESIPHALCRRRGLYHSSIQRATRRRASARVAKQCLRSSSISRVEKNDSATALSNALPTRPIDWVISSAAHASANASAVYTSAEFAQLCARHGVIQSMGATGICWDNAAAESFFATLKRELVHRHPWATRAHAKRAIVRWIEGWYNPRRLHSSIDYLTPTEKENEWHTGDHRAA